MQREEKQQREQQKQAEKEARAKAQAQKKAERLEQGRVAPTVMFKTAEYSAWDEKGIPTLDSEGNEVSKSKRKKLEKEYALQTKLHEEFIASGIQ